jgi:hypothetical protein
VEDEARALTLSAFMQTLCLRQEVEVDDEEEEVSMQQHLGILAALTIPCPTLPRRTTKTQTKRRKEDFWPR